MPEGPGPTGGSGAVAKASRSASAGSRRSGKRAVSTKRAPSLEFERRWWDEGAECVVGIDEVQFFDNGILEVCEHLADAGKRVICAGLDMDFRGLPFGPMPALLARAEHVDKLHAICVVCGCLLYTSPSPRDS